MASLSRWAQALIVVALACVVVATAWYGRFAWTDSGWFAVVLFGIPLGCTAAALWAERASGTLLAPVLIAVLGVLLLAWSLLTGLGIGMVFALPSLLLLAAAMFSWGDRLRRQTAVSLRN